MKNLYFLIFLIFGGCLSTDLNKTEADSKDLRPYVVLVSIDGYRHDYAEKFGATNLINFAKGGVRAEALIPVFPTLTFPNHYSIITGQYPTRHGIVSNDFYNPERKAFFKLSDARVHKDSTWYGGRPVWRVASVQGLISASFFWVGSEANLSSEAPTYFHSYDGKVLARERIDGVIGWLKLPAKERPHFITLYFSTVDAAGHETGTDSIETRQAVQNIDSELAYFFHETDKLKLPLYTIIVSDHGMVNVDAHKLIFLEDYLSVKNFIITGGGAYVMLYSSNAAEVEKTFRKLKKSAKNFSAYKKSDLPERFHMKPTQEVGDLVLVAEQPYYMISQSRALYDVKKLPLASHGWETSHKEMHGFFAMKGPGIPSGKVIPAFENIHVYTPILKLLGLKAPHEGEGSGEPLMDYLP